MKTRGLRVQKTRVQSVDLLTEAKAYLRIETEEHDDTLTTLLSAAVEAVESFCGVSLSETTVTARWESLTARELPYGPVVEILSITDGDGGELTQTETTGEDGFLTLTANLESPVAVTYTAGYTDIPASLQLAVIQHAAYWFENRTGPASNHWRAQAAAYRRATWLG